MKGVYQCKLRAEYEYSTVCFSTLLHNIILSRLVADKTSIMSSSAQDFFHRKLSFLDDDDGINVGEQSTGFVLAHSILSVASFISIIQGVYETRRKHYLYDRDSIRYFFPWAAFCQMVENVVLAIQISGRPLPTAIQYVVYALESTLAPCLLLSTFDVTYSIHKTRHIPFCCVYDGQTHTANPRCKMGLKICMRVLALGLLSLSILSNFNIMDNKSPYAGRVGWYWVVTEPWTVQSVHVVLELLPIAVTSCFTLYFSMALWRYGTSYSMVVHASPLNPWFSPFFGTMALMGGQWFGPRWFPLLSNLGIFVFVETILLLFMEVNKDMEAANELRDFLGAIGGKSSDLSMRLNRRETAGGSSRRDLVSNLNSARIINDESDDAAVAVAAETEATPEKQSPTDLEMTTPAIVVQNEVPNVDV
jgi:hypothetical protein